MKKDSLFKYCIENEIFVPNKAVSKEYLEAAIVRHFLNKNEAVLKIVECFGFWENENSDCMVCDHSEKCRSNSIGMDWEKYRKAVDREENKKIRF